tara:strand:- start:3538 stop:3738 length:201 start_codon:yes stop_codon:yes gene_type:complete
MKAGDLVKLKWINFASMERGKKIGKPVGEPGLVIEEARGAIKVMFPSRGNKVYTFLKDNVELINGI